MDWRAIVFQIIYGSVMFTIGYKVAKECNKNSNRVININFTEDKYQGHTEDPRAW